MKGRRKFGEILIDAGVLSKAGLQSALTLQGVTGKRLGQLLEERKIITERDIAIVLARQFGLKRVTDIADHQIPDDVLALVDGDEALRKLIFPIRLEKKTLLLAMVNPHDVTTIDEISFRSGLRVVPLVTTAKEISAAVDRHFEHDVKFTRQDCWRIVLADDQDGVRSSLAATLRKAGSEVAEADNGAQALKVIMEQRPHLVVCGLLLSRLDGFELMRTLLQNGTTRHLPVIALSYKSTVEEEARVLGCGFFDFIAKPVHPMRLQARVQRALEFVYGELPQRQLSPQVSQA